MSSPDITLVTACDAGYFWGAFLLAASIRRHQLPGRVLVMQAGFDAAQQQLLAQFPDVTSRPADPANPYRFNNRKAEALLLADTEYLAWLDADCFIAGPVGGLLVPANGEFQARRREPAENASAFDRSYEPGEPRGGMPKSVLERWQRDVGERVTPRGDTTYPSNCFVIHARHRPFLEHWDRQIRAVIPPHAPVLNRDDPAYALTDEAVLNSLLLFAHVAPAPAPYQLDRDPAAHVVHFIGSPKPWAGWTKPYLYCLPKVFELLAWLAREGYATPPVPPSFRPERAGRIRAAAALRSLYRGLRSRLGRALRLLGR